MKLEGTFENDEMRFGKVRSRPSRTYSLNHVSVALPGVRRLR